MHLIEPFSNWRDYYIASEDERSPLFNQTYNEFAFSNTIYNYYIHPQWDNIESPTLYIKVLYANYKNSFCIIELIGEWNDCINNDIMTLKRNILDDMIYKGINKYIIIGENILNFHGSDDCYYEDWKMDCENGWIAFINFRDHIIKEMKNLSLNHFVYMNDTLSNINWRIYTPINFFNLIQNILLENEPKKLKEVI